MRDVREGYEVLTGLWTPPTGNYGGTWRVEEDVNEGLYERTPERTAVVVLGASVEDVKAGLWLLAGITPLGKQAAIEAALAAKVEEGRDA